MSNSNKGEFVFLSGFAIYELEKHVRAESRVTTI